MSKGRERGREPQQGRPPVASSLQKLREAAQKGEPVMVTYLPRRQEGNTSNGLPSTFCRVLREPNRVKGTPAIVEEVASGRPASGSYNVSLQEGMKAACLRPRPDGTGAPNQRREVHGLPSKLNVILMEALPCKRGRGRSSPLLYLIRSDGEPITSE